MVSRTHIVTFLVALLVSAVLTPVVRRIAHRFGWVDTPNHSRKIHRSPMPRVGGIALALGFFAPFVGLLLYSNNLSRLFLSDPSHVLGLFVGGLLILGVGVWDDVRGLGAWKKLSFQVAVALLMAAFGFVIDRISIPGWGVVALDPITGVIFAVVWFVVLMNAVNLIDGLDGLAGGVAFFAVATLYIVASLDSAANLLTTLFAASLAGSVVGFLFYNFNPATIFMGDGGSLFLGFVIAAVSIQTQAKSSTAIALSLSILALGLPLLDTVLAVWRRLRRGQHPFRADRGHIHHRLLAMGLTQRQATLTLYGLCALLGVFAIAVKLRANNDLRMVLIIGALAVVLLALFHLFRFRELLAQRQRALLLEDRLALSPDARLWVRDWARSIRTTPETSAVWDRLCEAAQALQLRSVDLKLYIRRDSQQMTQHHYSLVRDDEDLARLPYETEVVSLLGKQFWYGDLAVTFRSGSHADDLERRVLVRILGEAVSEHIETHQLPMLRDRFVVSRLTKSASGPTHP